VRTLPRLLRDAGLVDVEADAFCPITGAACARLEQATVTQIRDGPTTAGLPPTKRSTSTSPTLPQGSSTSPLRP